MSKYPPYFKLPDDGVMVIEPTQVPDMRDKGKDAKTIKSKEEGKTFTKWKMRVECQNVRPDDEWGITRDWMMWEEEYDLFYLLAGGSYSNVKGRQFKVWKEEKKLVIETDDGTIYRHEDLDSNREPRSNGKATRNSTPWTQPLGETSKVSGSPFLEVFDVRALAIMREAAALRAVNVEPTAEALSSAATSAVINWEKSGSPSIGMLHQDVSDGEVPPHDDDDLRDYGDEEDER